MINETSSLDIKVKFIHRIIFLSSRPIDFCINRKQPSCASVAVANVEVMVVHNNDVSKMAVTSDLAMTCQSFAVHPQ